MRSFLEGGVCTMLFHNQGLRRIVPKVDGAGCVAVQAATIASNDDHPPAHFPIPIPQL